MEKISEKHTFKTLFHKITSPRADKWSHYFSKQVNHLGKISLAKNDSEKKINSLAQKEIMFESTLNNIEPFVKRKCFKGIDHDLNKARQDLLLLWRDLVKALQKTENPTLQTRCYYLINFIMIRQEFSLSFYGVSSFINLDTVDVPNVELIREYLGLLVDTFIVVVNSVSLNNGNLVETLQFCSNLLAVLYFRLPSVQSLILQALEDKRRKFLNENSNLFDRQKKRSVIKTLRAKQKINRIKNMLLEKPDNDEPIETKKAASPVFAGLQSPLLPLFSEGSQISVLRLPSCNSRPRNNSKSSILGKHKPSKLFQLKSVKKLFTYKERVSFPTGINNISFHDENPDLYNWYLFENHSHTERLAKFLSDLSTEPECFTWLKEKETFFITFVNSFATHINTVAVGSIDWSSIYGFDILLENFWPLMRSYFFWKNTAERQPERAVGFIRTKTAANYVETSYKLLLRSYPCLVSELIYLALCETNVLSYKSVLIALDEIKYFIDYVGGTHLNIEIYWFGLESCLEQENVNIKRKVVLHLFETLPLLHSKERQEICSRLLTKFFFKLFLHWSPEVRLLFHALLVFKFFRLDRKKIPCHSDEALFATVEIPHVKKFVCTGGVLGVTRTELKDEEKLIDSFNVEMSSDQLIAEKLDNCIFRCIDASRTATEDDELPASQRPYLITALKSYTQVLSKYYSGEPHDTTEQILKALLALLEENGSPKLDSSKID